jgi:hypothetical protein
MTANESVLLGYDRTAPALYAGRGILVFTRSGCLQSVWLNYRLCLYFQTPYRGRARVRIYFLLALRCEADIKWFKCDIPAWHSPFDLHLRPDRYNPSHLSDGAGLL